MTSLSNNARFLTVFVFALLTAGALLAFVEPGKSATTSTVPSNVTVNSFVSIGVSNNLTNGVLFGSVNPSTLDNNATYNYNATATEANSQKTSYWIYGGLDSNSNIDLCIRDNESLRTGGGATPTATINNGNYTYSNSTTSSVVLPLNYGTNNMTRTLDNSLGIRFATNLAPASPMFLRFFLNVTTGQSAGIYSNGVIFQAVGTGSSVTCGGT